MSKKVLLIEDDRWLGELQADVLVQAGYDARVATDALMAIDMIDAQAPDVIVADVLLAGSTIFTLFNELQSHTDTASIPVILCTSIAEQFSAKQLQSYNVKRVVDKTTMSHDAVIVAIRAVVGNED